MDVSHTCGMTEWTWLALWFFLGRMSEEGWDGRLPAVKSLERREVPRTRSRPEEKKQ